LARIWAHEPPLVQLARNHFGEEFTEADARFFAAIAANDWADFRPSPEARYDARDPASWSDAPILKANRIIWLADDQAALKLVPSRGIWLRGASIEGKIDLYRAELPFSLTFYDCLLDNGLTLTHAKVQELDIRNSCSGAISARGVHVLENVYLHDSCVYGGLDFVDAQIAGDFDFARGTVFHDMPDSDHTKPGVAINLFDAKVGGDVRLCEKFSAAGQVRMIGVQIGRSLTCNDAEFQGAGETAIDASRCQVAGNVLMTEIDAEGGVLIRRGRIGGDLDCDGGRLIAADVDALNADMVKVGDQIHLGDGFHAEGEVRLINAISGGDVDCDNGHFLHPDGDALSLDGAVVGRSLRLGYDGTTTTDESAQLPAGFFARGAVRLWDTQINQDILATGGEFETPQGAALLASNLRVAGRVVLVCAKVQGTVNLFSAQIEHDLDLKGSHFDARQTFDHIALLANGMQLHGHLHCNQFVGSDQTYSFRADGLTSVQFATIGMHWDLFGAQLSQPGGDALDASDCRVGGYVNVDGATINGRASFSRAKIDGMWILLNTVRPERLRLDLRFAHIWVIKDDRLDDWPPAGQLQLEGLVYDHFDDDSPLGVEERLAWLRRQYASPTGASEPIGSNPLPADAQAAARQLRVIMGGAIAEGRKPSGRVIPAAYENESPAPETMVAPGNGVSIEAGEPASKPPMIVAPTDSGADTMAIGDEPDPAQAVPDPAGRRYFTQPYTQLASVYQAIGQDEQANAVLVARAERIGELAPILSAQGLWYRYLGRLIGYGYEPFRAIKIGLAIVAIGTLVFALGASRNLMAETKLAEHVLSQEGERRLVSATYPRFNPLVYSLDVFLPFVDLQQICYWLPGERVGGPATSRNCLLHLGGWSLKWSAVLRSYFWFQTLAGWTLCTLLAAAVTGIVES
jgi:hypothetical protein